MPSKQFHPLAFVWRLDTPRLWIATGLLAVVMLLSGIWGGVLRAATPAADRPGGKKGESRQLSKAFKGRLPIAELNEDEAIQHALNRLGYGPRPGDVDRVRKMGLEKWIELQLHPERIDDSGLSARLDQYSSLKMSPAVILAEYPTPEMAAKRLGISVDAYRKKLDEMSKMISANGGMGIRGAEDKRPQRVVDELAMAKLTRAIYSERQLYEQLVDFWFNHFNVFVYKDADLWLVGAYEREVIRPHVLGKFRELVEADAKSPAMLFYLDNWLSADPKSADRLKRLPPSSRPKPPAGVPGVDPKRGLNENYGRELLELHTVGVDGGYNQHDVFEVARSFTGWTIRNLREDPQFYFDERIHDPDPKRVMGKKIDAGGMKDGEKVIDMLSWHPSTAKFISTKLARRFVSDNPPPELVTRMAKSFLKTEGDIRAVLENMIYSPEFWSRKAYLAKIKTPFELVASTARALDSDVDLPMPLVQWIARIGEPLYQCLPPTGYPDRAEMWVNSGALLNRLNFAIAMATNRIRGIRVELNALVGDDVTSDPQRALDRAIDEFLAGQISSATRTTLEKESRDPQVLRAKLDDPVQQLDLGVLTGLVLGSPEFQRR
ncbi:MAG TPA: DUF1800 domain-containing protein [Candidatus Acidoferrales bacterium]|nr:DUF1800 domain-containing protein [Candidatus Acidoferrales bacterium]